MLTLEIVTPDGVALVESDIAAVVLRRRERRFEVGSEVAVLPGHAPMLLRLPIAPARYMRDGETCHMALCGGFAEVFNDRVVVLTPRYSRVSAEEHDPVGCASRLCAQWTAQESGSEEAIIGVLRRSTTTQNQNPPPDSR
jgi:F-type H+-transporting ATPase subunit epsilon